MSPLRPKAVIKLISAFMTANDPKRTLVVGEDIATGRLVQPFSLHLPLRIKLLFGIPGNTHGQAEDRDLPGLVK